jgi:D-alanyl-D-alanine-carboxypeptidase/D-alanyl-D-alanine-endopeptidase
LSTIFSQNAKRQTKEPPSPYDCWDDALTCACGSNNVKGRVVPPPLVPEAQIQAVLKQRIDRCRLSVGYAVGTTERGERRFVAGGHCRLATGCSITSETLFQIGSVTKLFTAFLLADMVDRGEVLLDDPVAAYLPAGVHIPEYNGRPIRLVDLATHTAGLPRRPSNLPSTDPANPHAGYTAELLHEFLSSFKLSCRQVQRWNIQTQALAC